MKSENSFGHKDYVSGQSNEVARILYYSKDIESFGTGLKRIADACDTAGVRYEFKKMKSGFGVCFYRSEEKADKSQ